MASSFLQFEREAFRKGRHCELVTIDRDDFYVECKVTPGAFPSFSVDGIPTPLGQVDALLENARLAGQPA